MRNKFISILLASLIAFSCMACIDKPTGSNNGQNTSNSQEESNSQKLEILKSDFKISTDDVISKIKSEYLLENGGYKGSDSVVAIITFPESSLIDTFNNDYTGAESVSDYALSTVGKIQQKRIEDKQKSVVKDLKNSGLIDGEITSYSTILNAVAVNTTYENLEKISAWEEVGSVILSDTFNRPKATSSTAIENIVDIYETGIFKPTGVDYTGVGTSVAVLDSGFDCSHSVFNTHRVESSTMMFKQQDIALMLSGTNAAKTTRDLDLGDVWYSNKIPFVYDYAGKDPDVFPYDSEHGTHVSGIIGGKDDYIKGIAPDAQMVLMKVFPDIDTGGKTEDILSALEDAVRIGVDAINMSLGSSCGFATEADNDRLNAVYDAIYDAGISLITAASNDYSSAYGGEQGNTNKVTNPDSATVGSPSTYEAALSVASISGTKSNYLLANGANVIFFNESNNIKGEANDFFEELYEDLGLSGTDEIELTYVTIPGVGKEANYKSYSKDYLKGKVALVRRGDNTFEDKALQAKRAGAIACIIYNNIEGDILMSMGKSNHIPTISISKTDGEALASKNEGKIKISLSQEAGPFMSDFSSWGPTPSLGLKPEITAHGGNIISSIPGGGYEEMSGTSMATPNLCGIVILIRQYLKDNFDLTAKEMTVMANQLLMSTATIVLNQQGNPYSPRKQGAGLASLYNAVNTKAYITVDGIDKTKLELGDDPTRKGEYEMVFNVKNLSSSAISYDLSVVGMTESVSASDKDFVAERPELLKGNTVYEVGAGATLSGTKITVEGEKTAKVTVKYKLTNDDKKYIDDRFPYGMFVEGFVKLTAVNSGDVSLNVPFLAFYGDWTEAPMFDKTYYEVESEAHNPAIDYEDKIKADYVATTPYGSYLYNYIIPLGTYLYDIDTSKYDAIPASEEHIALSDAFGTIDGIYAIYAGLLRNAKTMTYTVTDKVTGEVVYRYVDYNAQKAHYYGGMAYPYLDDIRMNSAKYGLVNNREYEFEMVGTLDYENDGRTTNKRNSFSFDFTLDNEAPVIRDVTYDKEYDKTLKKDRYYINMTVYDNHYVQSIYPIAFQSSSQYTFLTQNPIPVYGEKGGNTVVRFEITDMLDDLGEDELITSALAFSIDDYALNSNLYVCQLPGTRGDFKFTKDGDIEGTPITAINAYVGDVIDVTGYLASADTTAGDSKDYFKYLQWSSSDVKKAEVAYGLVECKSTGTVLITATEQMDGKDAFCTIRIKERPENSTNADGYVGNVNDAKMEEIRFSYFETLFAYSRAAQTSEIGETGSRIYINAQPSVSFYPGEQIKLYHQVKPWYTEKNYKLTYKSTNPSVADVDENGKVVAKKEGSARITLSVEGSNLVASLRVVVKSEFVIENRQLIAYKGLGGKVVIPDDEGILYISSYAFCLYETDRTIELPEDDYDANKIPAMNTTITEVVIPDGVEYIEKYAFYNCVGLKKVTIPSSVRFIRDYAFYKDSELEIADLSNVEAIGRSAFEGCAKLKEANLSKAYSLGVKAFKGCTSIQEVNVSALRNAGMNVFGGCTSLKSATLTANTKLSYAMFAGSGLTSIDIYEKEEIPDFCFAECFNLETINIHSDVVTIGYGAFCENHKLKTVNFASADVNSIINISDQAFYDCKELESITLPNKRVVIGEHAFLDCVKLSEVIFAKNTKIENTTGAIFKNTNVSAFKVNAENANYATNGSLIMSTDGTTVIFAAPAFAYGNYVLPSNVSVIGASAFAGANITSITFNHDVTVLEYAFANCSSLEKITVGNEVNVILNGYAFLNCDKLTTVENSTAISQIGKYAFAASGVENFEIGEGVEVGEGCFYQSKIFEVTVGADVKLGAGAFRDCVYLATVNMPTAGGVSFGELCFTGDISLVKIDLSNYTGVIPDQAFYACVMLKAVDLNKVTEIGAYAFADCSALNFVSLENVEKIGEGAFSNNNENYTAPTFNTITLPETLTEMGEGVFMGCMGLTNITIPDSLQEIPSYTFTFCQALEQVVLGNSVKKIGDYAFGACVALTQINTGNVEYFGENAFIASSEDPTPLRTIDLSSAVYVGGGAFAGTLIGGTISAPNLTKIGAYAFQKTFVYSDVETIKSFSAPKVEFIGEGAFDGNDRLQAFVIPKTLTRLDSMAFVGCTSIKNFVDKDGKKDVVVNDYLQLIDGVIYTVMPSGKLQLTAVPAGKQIETLVVVEGTYRIDLYAGNENKNITKVVLPDSLKLIGDYAFYGCNNLKTVEFRSVTAPTLESIYDSELDIVETDPGFALLHQHLDLFALELCYHNFVGTLGKVAIPKGQTSPLKMILPKNLDLAGYDSLVFEVYFGKVKDSQRSDYEAMEKNMILFLEYADKVSEINEVMLTHEKLINGAISYLNAIKQNYADYGIDSNVWENYVKIVTEAKETLFNLKLSNARVEVQQLQKDIDLLPTTFTLADLEKLNAIKFRLDEIRPEERALLKLDAYNKLLDEYNVYCQQLDADIDVAKTVANSVVGTAVPVATATAGLGALIYAIIKKRWLF